MKNPAKYRRRFLLAAHYGFFILITGILTAIIIIQEQNQKALREQLSLQTDMLLEAGQMRVELALAAVGQELMEMGVGIEEQIAGGTQTTGERIRSTNSRIQQIDAVYSGLLAEQQKRTLDSLYTEAELSEKEREAARLFRTGNYTRAGAEYALIAQARPENIDARFYHWYCLFLSNKLDRNNYRQIKEGLEGLERNGYHRTEIQEVLEYIAAEESGLSGKRGENQ